MTTEYRETMFDSELSRVENIRWLPWVGDKFRSASSRVLLLGESHYNWGTDTEGRQEAADLLEDPLFNRTQIEFHGINAQTRQKFYRNVERFFFQMAYPEMDKANILWRRIAYANLLLVPMGTHETRPESPWDLSVAGWKVALKECEIMQPTHVLVGGSNQCSFDALKFVLTQHGSSIVSESKSLNKIGSAYGRYLRARISSIRMEVSFVFVRHPSKFFNWETWGQYAFECAPELASVAK